MASTLVADRRALAGFLSTPEELSEAGYLREQLLPAVKITPAQSNGRVHTRGRLADIEGSIEYGHCADPRMMPPTVVSSVTYDASPYGLTDRVCLGIDLMQADALGENGTVRDAIRITEATVRKAKEVELNGLLLNGGWTGYNDDPAIAWNLPETAQPLDDIELLIDSVPNANAMVITPSSLGFLRRTAQFLSAMPQNVFGNPSRSDLEKILSDRFSMRVFVPRVQNQSNQYIYGDYVWVGHIEPGYSNPLGGVNGSSALLRPEVLPLGSELWHNPLPGAVGVGADEIKVGGWEDMVVVSKELGALLYDVDLSE